MNNKKFIHQDGVTFIEIMIVIVIMAAIAALAGPALFNQLGGAKVKQASIQLDSLKSTLSLYRLDNNKFPTSEQGLSALISIPNLGDIPDSWKGPYITGSVIPADPWGNDYIYESEGQTYELKTLGADGVVGGNGNDSDIICSPSSCDSVKSES